MRRLSDLFLTPNEKEKFTTWEAKDVDRSVSSFFLRPFWNYVVSIIPDTVAPNILSLCGLLFLIHAWYLCYMYMDTNPRGITLMAMLLVFAAHSLDGIDGKHAKNIHNDSQLGEFFAHCCSDVGFTFSTLVGCAVLGIQDVRTQWYLVQISHLIAVAAHLKAFKTKVISYSPFMGPGEAVFAFLILMGLRAAIGLEGFSYIIHFLATPFVVVLNSMGNDVIASDYDSLLRYLVHTIYYALSVLILFEAFTLDPKNSSTRNGVVFCCLYRMVPAVLIYLGIMTTGGSVADVICNGLFMSIVTSDLILAKMSSRDIHPWIVIFAMLSILDNFLIIISVIFYYAGTLYEISEYMQLSVFAVTVNVYVDGVYDMCHLGHFNSFRNALSYGTRLFVGVLSDESVAIYKRSPIMTMKERAEVVATSKYVHKVFAPAPFPGISADFIKKNRIHVVCLSPEYEKDGDQYYKEARALGITKVTPRTEGMSTTELIRRAAAAYAEDMRREAEKKAEGEDGATTEAEKKEEEAETAERKAGSVKDSVKTGRHKEEKGGSSADKGKTSNQHKSKEENSKDDKRESENVGKGEQGNIVPVEDKGHSENTEAV